VSAPAPDALPRLLVGAHAQRSLALDEHDALHGALPDRGAQLIAACEQAGLRGRGGAAFPTAIKLDAVARARRGALVVANGAEGEPASAKDGLLLTCTPHLVLDGAVAAARAVGASEAIVAVKAAHAPTVEAALDERATSGRDRVALRLAVVSDHFLAGEETALVGLLSGGPLLPTLTPPRPFERGVDRRPTLIQNVETLAHLALIARHGPHWYRQLGTASEPGSTLVTLLGEVSVPGVYEISRGTPLASLLEAAGGSLERAQALLAGGYFGAWVARDVLAGLTLEDAALAGYDAALGSGVLVVLPESACGPAETTRAARYLAGQSSGQCGPCHHGLPAIAGALGRLLEGGGWEPAFTDVRRWLSQVHGRGACHHPNGAVRFVASSLRVFAREWREHAADGRCPACRRSPLLPVAQTRQEALV
jgi:NADH:ubiquinone oxidoreductase subunit F (NADH-binding)